MEIVKRRRVGEERSLKLTDDLITEIITRLPAKDLVRFACVSKSWCSLISTDPYFSDLQLQRTALIDRPFLVVEKAYLDYTYYFNFWTDLDSVGARNSDRREIHDPFYDYKCLDTRVIGSCHGLLLLQQVSSLKMAVSNPTTRKHHLVPPNPAGNANVFVCGFGYDHVHNCYKLVTQIRPGPRDDHSLELMVYDVNKGTWRNLQFGLWLRSLIHGFEHKDCYSPWDSQIKCVDGGVYWCPQVRLGTWVAKNMICFVLAEEQFHVVETPDFGEVKDHPTITVFEGRLCLVCRGTISEKAEFWRIEMEYDKTKESAYSWRWTKFFVISDPYDTLPPRLRFSSLIPVCFSASKSDILFNVDYSELFWYDLGSKDFWELTNWNGVCKAWYCIGSFVGEGSSKAFCCVSSLVGNGIF